MDTISYEYVYNPKNLELAKINLFSGALDNDFLFRAGILLAFGILYYLVMPYIRGYALIIAEDRRKEDNKNKIKELIMMKEVQNELEKEMEETLLKAGIQHSKIA